MGIIKRFWGFWFSLPYQFQAVVLRVGIAWLLEREGFKKHGQGGQAEGRCFSSRGPVWSYFPLSPGGWPWSSASRWVQAEWGKSRLFPQNMDDLSTLIFYNFFKLSWLSGQMLIFFFVVVVFSLIRANSSLLSILWTIFLWLFLIALLI